MNERCRKCERPVTSHFRQAAELPQPRLDERKQAPSLVDVDVIGRYVPLFIDDCSVVTSALGTPEVRRPRALPADRRCSQPPESLVQKHHCSRCRTGCESREASRDTPRRASVDHRDNLASVIGLSRTSRRENGCSAASFPPLWPEQIFTDSSTCVGPRMIWSRRLQTIGKTR